ncbi:MAG: hypothetical protein CL758_08880 [Chloroflexi bacterium]|nr:hypothetical protein [Chloroflexota bacterium]|tara:strand:+ start:4708 stop:7407 length:2700 start_codon:yes stop_codon:yes gene_type:complete
MSLPSDHPYTKFDLKNAITYGLNQPGRKISEILSRQDYESVESQEVYEELRVWHKMDEMYEWCKNKLNVPAEKIVAFSSSTPESERGQLYNEIVDIITELRDDEEIVDWKKHTGIWRLKNSRYLDELNLVPVEFSRGQTVRQVGERRYWIYATSPEHWKIVKNENVWATEKNLEAISNLIKKGDRVIFYESKNKGYLRGIFEISSSWRNAKKGRWTDEEKRTYDAEVDLEKILIGDIIFNEIIKKLEIGKKIFQKISDPKQQTRMISLLLKPGGKGMPSNNGKSLEVGDYDIIHESMSIGKGMPSDQYFLLRQKTESVWNDVLGKQYEFGMGVPNRKAISDAGIGTKVILYTNEIEPGKHSFWGHGTIKDISKYGDKWLVTFQDFSFFNKTENSIELEGKYLKHDNDGYFNKKLESIPGYSYRNSINRITRKIYEEIISNNVFDEDTVMDMDFGFEDKNLHIPDNTQAKRGLEELRNELLIPEEKILEIVDALSSGRHILLAGPIGTGKTQLAKRIPEVFWKDDGGYLAEDHTATSDWNTQDVIGGIFPKINKDGEPTYSIQAGCVVDTVRKNWEFDANGEPTGKRQKIGEDEYNGVWLVIDEFNRADIDKAFGQLFTSLRTRELKIPTINEGSYEELKIPKDFRIIGTLNTQDKHFLFQLSDALKSRFAYIEIDIPIFEEKEHEMYYAANQAITDLDLDDKVLSDRLDHTDRTIINFDELPVEDVGESLYDVLEKAYTILDYVREFNKLGTAILKLMFQQILVSLKRENDDLNSVIENALMTNLIPQLENLSEPNLECLIALCNGQDEVREFIIESQKKQDRQSYVKTIYLLNNITDRYAERISPNTSARVKTRPYAKLFDDNEITEQNLELQTELKPYKLPRFIQALESLVDSNQLR